MRKRRDLNPRNLAVQRFSRPSHSAALPPFPVKRRQDPTYLGPSPLPVFGVRPTTVLIMSSIRSRYFTRSLLVAGFLLLAPLRATAALPPQSPTELAELTGRAVVATVTAVKDYGPTPPTLPEGMVGPIPGKRAQKVTLKVTEVIRWGSSKRPKKGTTIVVTKPTEPYSVSVGDTAIFLLASCAPNDPVLVGRYGTVGADQSELRAALKSTKAVPCG
jgi:hypothetical protein